jgi:hypothetical protein
MRRCVGLLLLLCLSLPAGAADSPARAKGDLYILGITLNQRPDAQSGLTIASYNWCAEEIVKVFREQGATGHRRLRARLVQADKATHAAVMEGLAWLRKHTTASDLVVMYVGAHGTTDPTEGWSIETADRKVLWGREIKTGLGKLPCNVLLMIETCTSGGFTTRHKNDLPVPPNVTALCACSDRQSTNNQLDMAVAEALYGRADFNNNGVIDLDELIRYVRLRYKEWWPTPKITMGSQMPVIIKAKTMPGSLALTRVSLRLAAVAQGGQLYSALLEKRVGARYRVHFLGWSSKPGAYFLTDAVGRDQICLPEDGRPLLVKQNGRWYPARLLRQTGRRSKVRYLGYNEVETVPRQRVYYPFVGLGGKQNYLVLAPTETPGGWEQLGPAGAWKGTRLGAVFKDQLYTIENNGYLYATDLIGGMWQQVGKGEFGETAFLFAGPDRLYTIAKDGSLYRVDPKTGGRARMGPARAWKGARFAAVLRGRLYTIEADGGLWRTDLGTARRTARGKPEFGETAFLFAAGNMLYTIETSGSLYRIDPKDGSWVQVGPVEEWKGTRVGVVLKGRLYSVEGNGCLYGTNLGTGKWKAIGKAEFGATAFMVAGKGRVYTIEQDGSLYGVSVR